MGISPVIEEQATKTSRVSLSSEINARYHGLGKSQSEMDQQIREFYNSGGWKDAKVLVSGSFQHVATASTWSLDPVEAMIDAICGVVFGVSPAPTTIPRKLKSVDGGHRCHAS